VFTSSSSSCIKQHQQHQQQTLERGPSAAAYMGCWSSKAACMGATRLHAAHATNQPPANRAPIPPTHTHAHANNHATTATATPPNRATSCSPQRPARSPPTCRACSTAPRGCWRRVRCGGGAVGAPSGFRVCLFVTLSFVASDFHSSPSRPIESFKPHPDPNPQLPTPNPPHPDTLHTLHTPTSPPDPQA